MLALVDDAGRGALQVIDLKTRGGFASFNDKKASGGHPLQHVPPSELSTVPQSDEETQILHEHRLQLALYSVALEAMEARKPPAQRRTILPPALLIGANGRIVQLSEQAFDVAKGDLLSHLDWRATVHLNPASDEPTRLPAGSLHCGDCPFYKGDLRRCGPAGESLGFVNHLDGEP